jgi:hypothetical protein
MKLSGLKPWRDIIMSVNLVGRLKDLLLNNTVFKVDIKAVYCKKPVLLNAVFYTV